MLFVSEMDERAEALARARGIGLELIEFCMSEALEDDERVVIRAKKLRGITTLSVHAPYAELFPCAVDPEAREFALRRLTRAGEVCVRLGARRLIAHTGCAPRLYYPEWYVPRSIEFWRELLRRLPDGLEVLLENVLDPEPTELATIVDGVNDAQLAVCLDVGHANVYSPRSAHEWVTALGSRIRHVHLHDNDGQRDQHAALGQGSMDAPALLSALRSHAPDADWCVESREAEACLAYLEGNTAEKQTKVCKTAEERGSTEPIKQTKVCHEDGNADRKQTEVHNADLRKDISRENLRENIVEQTEVCDWEYPDDGSIPPLDVAAMDAARERQRQLAKPPGSLGLLEEISIRFAGMTGRVRNRAMKRRLLVFAADNGVTAEGVSSAPRSVTLAQTVNLARGLTGAATLARRFCTELRVYDVGVDAPGPLGGGVIHRRIARGTRNLANGPAMSRAEALTAMRVGFEAAAEAAEEGVEIIGVGEMGIGNTTTSAALLSALLGLPAEACVGRGGGVNDAGFARKIEIVEAAVERISDRSDVLGVLSEVGGFDLAAMCGAFLGAASRRLPVVIDGYISVVAALCAERIVSGCRNYLFASHASWERGYRLAVEALGLKPMLSLEMRLGEGSGCPLAFEIIDGALVVLNEMATFDEARIDDAYLNEIRADVRLQR